MSINKCMRCGLSLPQNGNNRVGQYHTQCYEMKELVDQISDLKLELAAKSKSVLNHLVEQQSGNLGIKDKRIAALEKALEVAHADLIKWGKDSRELNVDLGKISYALNNGGK